MRCQIPFHSGVFFFQLNDSTFVEKTSDKKTDPIFHVADDRHKVAVFAPKSKANREVGALASDAYTRYLDLRGANVSSKEAQKRVDIFFTKSDDFIERQVDRVSKERTTICQQRGKVFTFPYYNFRSHRTSARPRTSPGGRPMSTLTLPTRSKR